MKNLLFTFSLFAIVLSSFSSFAQTQASRYGYMSEPIFVPSIADQIANGTFKAADPNAEVRKGMPKHRGANITVPGKGLPKGDDALVSIQKSTQRIKGKEPIMVFDANISNYTPSDPTGAVGPNHF
ncbi:MAG: hypothetical protein C0598_07880, partial [Marinilabiliales bacterium]